MTGYLAIASPTRTKKSWGHEDLIHNGDGYCSKLLVFKKGGKCSVHFHGSKTETFYVSKGIFSLTTINTADGSRKVLTLIVGDVVHIPRYQPHQLLCLEEGMIFEASTTHDDADSYRVEPGDSQTVKQ